MGVRRNAKFLTAGERAALVQAFVLMKADIVNPGAPPAERYSRWDEAVALHWMIQDANMPGFTNVNFGHGGAGAYGFLPWHRYFLYRIELQLQSYVPGVMIPYWDWTDPAPLMVADFMGPNGDPAFGFEVTQGYFAREAPGTGANLTPAPGWWPAGLDGWSLHPVFGTAAGALRRQVGPTWELPSVASVRSALDMTTLPTFQNALESGTGTAPPHLLHNGLHGWFGGGSHMSSLLASPFDPLFYLHHCNIDRLWAMWQMDGHATDYPAKGGNPGHHLTDPMYPWHGGLPGYSTNNALPPILMPDFSGLGTITPEDVLDHRALGYSYDTEVVIGVLLDRTGSMMGMTPDPMTVGAPDVTKWEAAKRGVSAFLLDCETAYASAEAYVVSGIKTFRRLIDNDFQPVFAGTPYGLVKPTGPYGQASFDAAIALHAPGGSTPLVDALVDGHASLVAPPFGGLPAGERRYLALLTDGMLTSGSPLRAIPDGSLTGTAIFTMGFGTGADVDYATLAALVAKGQVLSTPQVFHGENAGTIDKFHSQALAAAIGFSPVSDPVLELFEGEHAHLEFTATSAEDAFFLTAQGMDFEDPAWSYQLIGPDGALAYASGGLPCHGHSTGHGGRRPRVTTRRSKGRLSLVLQRDSADASAWVGTWKLLCAWRATALDRMVMVDPGYLMVPPGAGPLRGPRYARLLTRPELRAPGRAIPGTPRHRLDVRATSTGSARKAACSLAVNVYARSRLQVGLRPGAKDVGRVGDPLTVDLVIEPLRGTVSSGRSYARLVAPAHDFSRLLRNINPPRAPDDGGAFDAAMVLAHLEKREPRLAWMRDEEQRVMIDHGAWAHVHVQDTWVPGVYQLGVWLVGVYWPDGAAQGGGHEHALHAPGARHAGERFARLLNVSVGFTRSGAG